MAMQVPKVHLTTLVVALVLFLILMAIYHKVFRK